MNKTQISNNYMTEMKNRHIDKKIPEERNAIVIGSSENNIGKRISERLKQDGFSVDEYDITNFDCSKIENVASKDFSKYDTIILANGSNNLDWVENQPFEIIKKQIDDILLASCLVTKKFVSDTIEQPFKKHIVFIGSMAYKAVLNGSSIYCAAKAGISHFMKCVAWELAPKGYDVFAIHPSNTLDAPMSEATIQGLMKYRNLSRQQAEEYWGAILPKKSFLTKDQIAEMVSYAVSGKAEYLSGCDLELKGGQR